jgi:hypothetical protein
MGYGAQKLTGKYASQTEKLGGRQDFSSSTRNNMQTKTGNGLARQNVSQNSNSHQNFANSFKGNFQSNFMNNISNKNSMFDNNKINNSNKFSNNIQNQHSAPPGFGKSSGMNAKKIGADQRNERNQASNVHLPTNRSAANDANKLQRDGMTNGRVGAGNGDNSKMHGNIPKTSVANQQHNKNAADEAKRADVAKRAEEARVAEEARIAEESRLANSNNEGSATDSAGQADHPVDTGVSSGDVTTPEVAIHPPADTSDSDTAASTPVDTAATEMPADAGGTTSETTPEAESLANSDSMSDFLNADHAVAA